MCSAALPNIRLNGLKNCCHTAGRSSPGKPVPIYLNIDWPPGQTPEGFMSRLLHNQEFVLFDPISNEEGARCHQLLDADKITLAGSGFPDPKQININGIDYHQLSKGKTQCKHCREGVPTDYEKII
jgi:hypothetical protein